MEQAQRQKYGGGVGFKVERQDSAIWVPPPQLLPPKPLTWRRVISDSLWA